MADNSLPKAQPALWALAADLLDGLTTYEAALGIAQNTGAKLTPEFAAAKAAQAAFEKAGREEDDAVAARNIANSNVKAALALTKRQLGGDSSADAAVWRGGSQEIPYSIPDRLALLGRAADFLRDNPDYEVTTPKITFTQAALRGAVSALEDARGVLNGKVAARVDAKAARAAADSALRSRMSGLVQELGQPGLLDEDDDRWYAFGLVPPAGVERPGIAPDDLVLRKAGPGVVIAGWSATPRAHRYRVFAKVEGRDVDFRQIDVDDDLGHTFEGLPTTGTLSVYIVATNPAGDSPASETAEISLAT